jgi:ABC-type transporter Mla subunit MlaD
LRSVVVGKVTDIRVRADLSQNPVEVSMLLQTPNELKLPADAVVWVEADGVLGPSFAKIETKDAKGPPVSDNATLRTVSFSLAE